MRESEIIRYNNTTNDLLSLGVDNYCDLGPGRGEIAIGKGSRLPRVMSTFIKL